MEEAGVRFLDLVGGRETPWRSIDLRTVAVKIGRRWTQLATRAYLDHRQPKQVGRLSTVERGRLRAWQAVLPVDDAEAVVRGFVEGCIRIKPRFLWVLGRGDRARHDLGYHFNDLTAPYRVAKYDEWSGHSVVGYGPDIWSLARQAGLDPHELDNIIRAGPNAYDGYAGLSRHYLGRPEPLATQNSSTVFEVIAPLAVCFYAERTSASPDRVALGMHALASEFTRSATLHWTVLGQRENPRHGSCIIRELDWKAVDSGMEATMDLALKKGDIFVNAFLEDQDRCLDRLGLAVGVGGQNRRVAAHTASDPGLERFHRDLFPPDWRRSNEFEQAVGILLHFFGFQLDPLSSQSGASGAVDHLAHDPVSDSIVAVECTVGPIEPGKVAKLVARTQALRDVLVSGEVIPVLACARPRPELTKTALEDAESERVVVIARDDLQDLWMAVERGGTSVDLLRDLRQRIEESALRVSMRRGRSVTW